MAGERPAFTLEAAKRGRNALPVEAWAVAAAGVGVLAGAALSVPSCLIPEGCRRAPEESALLLTLASLLAATAWFALPVRDDRQALLRAAGVLGIAAALLALLSLLSENTFLGDLLLCAAAGAAAPLAMLSAARPEAALEWGAPGKRRTLVWIRAGTIPAFALAAGFSLGLALAWTNGATGSALSPLWNILVGGPLLAIAGVLLFAFGTVESGSDSAEARPAGRRARLVLGMTPMQRYDFVMECALAFAGVASLTALALGGSRVRDENDAFAAILFGGGIGVLMFALVAPSVDLALGRGRLLALAPALAAVAPLLVGASIPTGDLFALFGASALFAFAWASAPQRYALTFDLSPSKGRLRAACDIQGTKLFVAALAPSIYLGSEKFLTGSGLIVASGFCVLALAIFAPTLGGLGRPQK